MEQAVAPDGQVRRGSVLGGREGPRCEALLAPRSMPDPCPVPAKSLPDRGTQAGRPATSLAQPPANAPCLFGIALAHSPLPSGTPSRRRPHLPVSLLPARRSRGNAGDAIGLEQSRIDPRGGSLDGSGLQ